MSSVGHGKWQKVGADDAKRRRYPLYSVLIIADRLNEAKDYARGWGQVTGRDLTLWRDGHKR
jgi:hypothetical protein